jgi:thiol-disulfide isomerase/thioredoxin
VDKRSASHTRRSVVSAIAAMLCTISVATAHAVTPGEAAPRCDLAALGVGPGFDTSAIARGRVVLVDFWASWCAPCAHAFGALNALERDFREAGFSVIAVNVDEDPDDAVEFLDRHPASFAIGSDTDGACPRAYDVVGMPSSYLVDRRGVVRSVHRGFRPGAMPALRDEIEALLAESLPRDDDAAGR